MINVFRALVGNGGGGGRTGDLRCTRGCGGEGDAEVIDAEALGIRASADAGVGPAKVINAAVGNIQAGEGNRFGNGSRGIRDRRVVGVGRVGLVAGRGAGVGIGGRTMKNGPVEGACAAAVFLKIPRKGERTNRGTGVILERINNAPRGGVGACCKESDGTISGSRGDSVGEIIESPRRCAGENAGSRRSRSLGGRGDTRVPIGPHLPTCGKCGCGVGPQRVEILCDCDSDRGDRFLRENRTRQERLKEDCNQGRENATTQTNTG